MSQDFKRLQEIGRLLRTQDNRITDAPIFAVEQRVRDYGYDGDHSFDGYEWTNPGNDHETADPKKADRLDKLAKAYRDTGPWEKIYYKERWEFVTACFTEQGCLDYLKINGHNLRETRIYAYGSYRNQEYRDVREHLLGLPDAGNAITIPADPRYPTDARPLVTSAMKAECMGEFYVEVEQTCPYCNDGEPYDGCIICKGEVTYTIKHQVPWTTMKEIYRAMVKAAAQPEPDQPGLG